MKEKEVKKISMKRYTTIRKIGLSSLEMCHAALKNKDGRWKGIGYEK